MSISSTMTAGTVTYREEGVSIAKCVYIFDKKTITRAESMLVQYPKK